MNFKDTEALVLDAIQADIPVFIEGSPGIGKSQLVYKVAKSLSRELFDIRLTLINPIDLRGIPFPDKETGITRWLPPAFLPAQKYEREVEMTKDKDKDGNLIPKLNAQGDIIKKFKLTKDYKKILQTNMSLIFLDELNAAPKQVQASAYQLVLDRKVGEYTVPKGIPIISAGNKATDRAIVHEMPAPLRNRFCRVELEADIDSWKEWAYKKDAIDMTILSYLTWRPEALFSFDRELNSSSFPTPRSWEMLSKMMSVWQKDTVNKVTEITGLIGEGTANEFIAFIRLMPNLKKIEEILEGKKVDFDDKPGIIYALCGALLGKSKSLVKQGDFKKISNIMKFIHRLKSEYVLYFMRDFIRTDEFENNTEQCMDKIIEIENFLSENCDYIISA